MLTTNCTFPTPTYEVRAFLELGLVCPWRRVLYTRQSTDYGVLLRRRDPALRCSALGSSRDAFFGSLGILGFSW